MLSIYNRYDQYNPVEIRNYCKKNFSEDFLSKKMINNYKSILNIDDYEYNKYDPNLNLDTNNLKSRYDKKYKDYKKSKDNFFYQSINTKKLDNIINPINKHLLIKIDVERHELFVLKGAEKILTNNKIFLQIEIFPKLFDNINNFLLNKNFKLIKNIDWDYYYKNY